MKRFAPLLTLAAVAVLGAGLFALNMTGFQTAPPPEPAAVAAAAAPEVTTAPAEPPAQTGEQAAQPTPESPAIVEKAYTGRSSGDEVTVAIAVKDGRAVGYVCDGKKIEAWVEGTVEGDKVSLVSATGLTTVTGTISDTASFGDVTVKGKGWPYSAKAVVAPAGLYEGRANIDGVAARIGWIVENDGKVTGLATTQGSDEPVAAPAFDPNAPGATQSGGTPVTVTTVDGSVPVVAR